jgi:hypothetical protein
MFLLIGVHVVFFLIPRFGATWYSCIVIGTGVLVLHCSSWGNAEYYNFFSRHSILLGGKGYHGTRWKGIIVSMIDQSRAMLRQISHGHSFMSIYFTTTMQGYAT